MSLVSSNGSTLTLTTFQDCWQTPQLVTLEGYTIPISINSRLAHILPVHIPSNHDLQTLPHVVFTSP